MRSKRTRVLATGIAAFAIASNAETNLSRAAPLQNDPVAIVVAKGEKWLVSVQGISRK